MRRINFRVWDKDLKLMMYVLHPQWKGSLSYWPFFKQIESLPKDYSKLMQYVGLKDINDNPVFEGDILKLHGETFVLESIEDLYHEDLATKVEFSKVIGNIYEHKNLLDNKYS